VSLGFPRIRGVLIASLFISLTSLFLPHLWAQSITVAAAADLNPALTELAAKYKTQTGNEVRLSFGASGNLTQQIRNGAPFDLFFSADEDYPRQLIAERRADRDSLYRYAIGRLVLWLPVDSTLDLQGKGINVLLDPAVKKISMANPLHAPYGRAAEAALRLFGLYEKVAGRLVLGENVSQAAQFVESGNAQAGLVALSHALDPGMKNKGKYWPVPTDAYPELDQGAVILSTSTHKKEAAAFLEYLRGAEARSILEGYGFSLGAAH
jgi:molybdate transport system substrate-binding protein